MSTSHEQKKAIEKAYLSHFLSHLDIGVHQIEEVDPPDFILHRDTGKISIELTRLIDPKEMKVEQYKENIVGGAQRMFNEKYSDDLYVLVTFNNILLRSGKKAAQAYSHEVFKSVEKIYSKHAPVFDFHSPRSAKVSRLIDSLSVRSSPEFDHWQSFGAYIVGHINTDWFESRIRIKEEKSEKDEREYSEKWLVFITDLGTKASTHCFSRVDFELLDSTFDRIYIYQFMPNTVTVVK